MIFIIAHRMRTVDGVDKIVVLKDGVVAEQGIYIFITQSTFICISTALC